MITAAQELRINARRPKPLSMQADSAMIAAAVRYDDFAGKIANLPTSFDFEVEYVTLDNKAKAFVRAARRQRPQFVVSHSMAKGRDLLLKHGLSVDIFPCLSNAVRLLGCASDHMTAISLPHVVTARVVPFKPEQIEKLEKMQKAAMSFASI